MNNDVFNKVEAKTKVKKETIISLVDKLANGNMKDEKTLSEVIDALSKETGKTVSNELKEKIIKTIKEDKVPSNVDKMF